MSDLKRPMSKRINGRFAPGHSGNPVGRPKGPHAFSQLIREKVDTKELIRIAVSIARGQGIRIMDIPLDKPTPAAVPVSMPTAKDQMKAIEFLVAWGFIKPPTQKQVAIDDGRETKRAAFDPSKLTDEQLHELDDLLELAGDASPALPAPDLKPAIRLRREEPESTEESVEPATPRTSFLDGVIDV